MVDFDLHGLARVRLIDAGPGDVSTVRRQLGPIQTPVSGEPDLLIRFVDKIPTGSGVRYLGLDEAAFTDDSFFLVRRMGRTRRWVQIPFGEIGQRCEILCERGLAGVPLLTPILNLTVLSRGALPLHASAFTYNGTGIVTTGWAKGGKTETLLAFMARGAAYIGDEWIYISPDGRRMCGIPQPIRVWDWHLQHAPEYRALVGRGHRARMRAIKLLQSVERAMPRAAGLVNGLMPVLLRQLYVDVSPERLFGGPLGPLSGSFDQLYFVMSGESPDVRVEPMEPQEVARRMVFSLVYENLYFMSYYMKFRFAFPEAANPLIEGAEELQRRLLLRMLEEKTAYAVYHPYPAPIPALFRAISPLCR